jgi:hypothetical protein
MACLQVDRLLLLQTVLYFIIVTTGLATAISSALTRNEFHGLCILYGDINCTDLANEELMVFGGRASICTFITAINLLICVFYAFVCGCYHAYYVHRSKIVVRIIYKLWLKTLLLATILVILLILVAAGTLTIGLSMWCSTLGEIAQSANKTTACADDNAWGNWTWRTEIGSEIAYSGNYYDQYYVALTSCWVSVTLWIIHLMLYIRHLIRQCQLDRSYQEPFTADLFDSFT